MSTFIRYHCSGCCNMAFENPPVLWREIITVEQIFFHQLPSDDESVASEGQALGLIRSRLGIETNIASGRIPFPFRLVEVSVPHLSDQERRERR